MANFKQTTRKIGKFFKKNGYIFLIIICIAAIGTMIGLAVANSNKAETILTPEVPIDNENDDNELPVDNNEDNVIPEPISFAAPSTGTVGEGGSYSTVSVVYNQTTGDFRTHQGVDFFSETDANVYAACNGVVDEVVKGDLLLGNYVIIKHAEGYESRYYSLDADIKVAVGQTVTKGDIIGIMSNSMPLEENSGAHLHFEMAKAADAQSMPLDIDPLTVIVLREK
ncbi:MAG TPA: M23 family metallopeptidase [Clostridia bacterium]|nr:M23 family metallopeptidase [Clostridia bacterium]